MGTAERRARERAEVRDRILQAARDLFVDRGFEAVTLRSIAEAVEYSPAALYSYFPDKDALLFALVQEDFRAFAGQFHALAEVADPIERLIAIGRTYIAFAVRHPNHYRLMFMSRHATAVPCRPEKYEDRGDPARDAYAFVKWTVEQGIACGRFRPGFQDVELVCQALWACMHGIAALEITHRGDAWVEWRPLDERTAAVTTAVLAGMTRVRTPAAQEA